MSRPLLPPSGIFVPIGLIFNDSMPPVLLQTWIQLRCLAWGATVTPCMPVKEMAAIIGKSPATLYRHMAQLRHLAALSWRTTGSGSLIVSFMQQATNNASESRVMLISPQNREFSEPAANLQVTALSSENPEWAVPQAVSPSTLLNFNNLESYPSTGEAQPMTLNSQNRELPYPHSLNSLVNSDVLMLPEIEPKNRESDQIMRNEVEGGGKRECEGERGSIYSHSRKLSCSRTEERSIDQSPEVSQLIAPIPDPVSAYRLLAHLTPNASQRRILSSKVTDLPLWQETLEHWLMHGWNPRNITGMLELYARGGPSGCRSCRAGHFSRWEAKTAQEHTHDALEDLRHELGFPSQPNKT
jgi:hypothetical protein